MSIPHDNPRTIRDSDATRARQPVAYDKPRLFDVLKPCPFCGSIGATVKHSGRWGWFVSCRCAAVGPSSSTKQEAIEAWNRRAE